MKNLILSLFVLAFTFARAQQKTEVFFEFDRYDLPESEQRKLDDWISKNPTAEVNAIYGYCDRTGSLQYNDSLSVRRANAVKDYLKYKDVALSSNLAVKGFGENFGQSKNPGANRKVAVIYKNPVPKPEPKPVTDFQNKVIASKVGEKIRLPDFHFFNMSDRFVPKSLPVLEELLKVMRGNPKIRIEIQGHICCQTVKEKDYAFVSTQRAKAVYDYLLQNGVAPNRLSYRGFGVSRPLHPIPEKNEKEQDENRRVEVEILSN